MRSAITVGIVLLLAVVAHATNPRIMTYGDGLDDLAADALLLDDGGMVIVGETMVAFEPEMIRHILAAPRGRNSCVSSLSPLLFCC
jgi:hypothetical protein